ncbi:hypothetical protein LOTGIDRAFT_201107 [Lottia gigantea]|uniref:Bile salt export pump n=1 Tax=Lottia gigantea TaxID=225164 RepID=V4A792_LOTGI|nr:hypothetical protein LOTGIDRAFT_201107 [Lottia gigantea]ESO99813.1 hypothetical protein LOTGIDRAFT_201107 [Lottia gigantea]
MTRPSESDLAAQVQTKVVYFCIIAGATFVAAYIAICCWTLVAERQLNIIRKKYFRAVMRQEIGWFDTHETGELNSRLSSDLHLITECVGDKMAILIQYATNSIGGYIMALVTYWKLALVTMAFSPVVFIITSFVGKRLRKMAAKESKHYSQAGAVAEESLRNIRTVQAFQGQEKEAQRYETKLKEVDKVNSKKGLTMGLALSVFWSILYIAFCITFWYGVKLFQDEGLAVGKIVPVFFGILIGSVSLGNAFPYIETISQGRGAADNIFKIIDATPTIDGSSDVGDKPKVEGNIAIKNVNFTYPARPDVQVLKNFSLDVDKGKVVALVGSSGSGKSTVIQLVQRFYDPSCGQVLLDGKDIKTLNVKFLRQQIGVVSQEPVLFASTIEENIRYGDLNASKDEIIQAAKEANAHSYITSLPKGYETVVGERGAQLSGGQKQRIAIARALVRNPKILLLDEATSALDHESEAVVQNALEKAEAGRTTIVIAHRLSTVRNADVIAVVSDGEIVELGKHSELMEKQGTYYNLVKTQVSEASKKDKDSDSDKDKDGDLALRPSLKRVTSITSEKQQDVTTKEVEEDIPPASFMRIIRLNSPESMFITLGTIASFIAGFNHPAFAFILSEYIRVSFFTNYYNNTKMADIRESSYLIIMFLIKGPLWIIYIYCICLQNVCLTKSGARLTSRIRKQVFRSYLKQDMEFFDMPNNGVGILSTKLASDSTLVQGATGSKIGQVVENATLLLVSLCMAFYYGWKLTFVILAFIPVMILSGVIQGRMTSGFSKADSSHLDKAGKICSEAVDNIRTVTSLTREDIFLQKYETLVHQVEKNGKKHAFIYSIFYALAQSIIFFAYAATFAYGSILVQEGEMPFFAVFRVFTAIVFGGMVIGRQSAYALDYSKAKVAAARLFQVIDRVPVIYSTNSSGKTFDKYESILEISNITFNYPSRPDAQILKVFTTIINPGDTVALVGHSGCGKSTVIQLIQRFYDPLQGQIKINSTDIRETNIQWLRSQIGIVSQEPMLFDLSIKDNIAYGDNSREIPMQEIIIAARNANIHTFIESLPQGYETNVGDKGSQLSGGQKQRIAIARALIRNPKILLLDEATSALDTQSEKVVQEALDKAREGRTCIVIAHRLSTIQSADKIIFVRHGKVEEAGTHSQLMELKGAYYRLHQAQNRSKS